VNVDLDRPARARSQPHRPPLDPAVWERADTRQALAARDLAAVFRLLRGGGTSQRTIAALTGLAPSEVYEIGRGRRVMAYDVLCRIADGLGVPRGYLGLAYDSETAAFVSATSPRDSHPEDDLDEVAALLAHAAEVAVGMENGPAALRWTAPREAGTPVPQRVTVRDVDEIEGITLALRSLDSGHGGGACREAVVAQSRWVRQLLHADATDDVRRRLVLASADLDNLAGWTSFDVGLHSCARGYFARALTQARRGGNASLVANVLYRAGRLHLHQGLAREALRFFQLGKIAAAESGCGATVALLTANQAWAYAVLGDRLQTVRALGRASDELAAGGGPAAPWISFFGAVDLEALTGMAWLELGAREPARLADARQSLTASVAARGSGTTRSLAFELTALAVASLRDGDTDAGAALGHQAVDVAERVHSVRVLDRLAPLAQAAAASRRPEARALTQRAAAVVAG
jgi:hypothetical protein